MGEGGSDNETDFREPWCVDVGCTEFVEDIRKVVEFREGIMILFSICTGNYF
jgi:hypothetical protein